MLTSLQKHIKNSILKLLPKKQGVKLSPKEIRRTQVIWVVGIGAGLLLCSYGVVNMLFDKGDPQSQNSKKTQTPTSIETLSHKVDPNEVFRHKVEEDKKQIQEELSALKVLFEEGLKEIRDQSSNFSLKGSEETGFQAADSGAVDTSILDTSVYNTSVLDSRIQQLESKLEAQAQSYRRNESAYLQQGIGEENHEGAMISKFTLSLRDPETKQSKTVETTIPAGAFAKTVLLSGLDASASMTAATDPRPMLLRLIDPGTLPRRFQSDLKDCHCTASAYGDLSSERVYGRLEKLTCIERHTGNIIETQVAGYIAGADGKAGIRGVVASKDGQFLSRSLMGGIFAGLSNVANPQNRQAQVNPFYGSGGGSKVSSPSLGEMFGSGMASGATSALDRLSQYYIDRAEQLQPVIQIAAGQVIDLVFTEGTFIGDQTVKSKIEHTREEARTSPQKGDNNYAYKTYTQ